MLLETCPTPEAAGQMARYLLDALAEPIELAGRRIAVTASAGIALVNRREQPPAEEILRNADIALYRAKDEGAGPLPPVRGADARRAAAPHGARGRAAPRDRRAASSSSTTSRSSRPTAARSSAPRRSCAGSTPSTAWSRPAQFIAVAEQAGLIELLGGWILREAVRQAAEWHRAGIGGGKLWVSVNLSVEQLANPALVGEVELALRDHGLPAELLVLELTESAVMRDVVTATQRLDALKRLGVRDRASTTSARATPRSPTSRRSRSTC